MRGIKMEQEALKQEVLEQRLPDTRDAGLTYSISALMFVFAGGALARLGLPADLYIILSEIIVIALPPVILARAKGLSMGPTFRIRMPRPVEVLLTMMIGPVLLVAGACAGLIALIVIRNAFGTLNIGNGVVLSVMGSNVFWALFLVGVVPAVCEELLFRGLIQRGLERLGAGWSIFLSGLLFGLFHFDFQRFAAQTLIGLVSAYLVYRTGSIFNGMLLHFMNNGLITLLTYSSLRMAQSPNPMPQITDPFSAPEFMEIAGMYGMSVDELLNILILPVCILLVICLVIVFGMLLAVRAVTAGRVELPGRDEKSARGLLLGIPGLALVLLVYTAIGLILLGNTHGTAILRILGL